MCIVVADSDQPLQRTPSLPFSSSPPMIVPEKDQKPSSFQRIPSNVSMAGLVAGMESGGWERDGTTIETTGHPVSSLPHPPLAVPLVIGSGSPQLNSIQDDQVGGWVGEYNHRW